MRHALAGFVVLLALLASALTVSQASAQASVLSGYSCPVAGPALVTVQGSHLSSGPLMGATIYGTNWHADAQSYLDTQLTLAASEGWNLIRPTDQWQSGDDPYNATIWSNMDHLVCKAAQMGMYVQLDLSGYRRVLQGQGKDAWTAANWTGFIDAVVSHYHAADNIFAISIVGEPTYPTTQAAADALTSFYRDTISEVERVDGHRHLVIAGGLTHLMYGLPGWWKPIFALEDLAAFKVYSLHDEQYLPTIRAATTKPLLNDEFGMPQYMGDATWSGQTYNGLQVSRASFFKTVLGYGFDVNIVWNLSAQLGGPHYDVSPQTPAAWAALKVSRTLPPPPPTPSPVPTRFPCAVDLNGVLTLGTCTGFTPNP